MADLRCQRIGCFATFTEDDNPEGSCRYHESGPYFHDGCKTGKHTIEKPVVAKPAAPVKKPVSTPSVPSSNAPPKDSCSRCRQGFFCSDHGSQHKTTTAKAAPAEIPAEVQVTPALPKKVVDINEPQTCKNKGCGKEFKEKDNHDTACNFHPGPAVFHDRLRGWKCCDIHVKEFEEFINIPPCTKGWHNADPTS